MTNGLLCRQSFGRTTNEEPGQQVSSSRTQFRNDMSERGRGRKDRQRLEVREGRDPRPRVLSRSSEQFEDSLELVVDIRPGKERAACIREFGEDTACRPHVDGGAVEFCSE